MTEGVETAIEQAKAAAGDKVIQVPGGAGVIQQLLGAGLADELRLDVMPVVFGGGLRLLETLTQSAFGSEFDASEQGTSFECHGRMCRQQ